MKKHIYLSILLLGTFVLLPGCNTRPGPDRMNSTAAKQTGIPRPYYRSNDEGNYRYFTGRETNPNYQPTVRRNRSARTRY